MTIILDENLPKPLKGIFPNHTVTTVQEQGLAGTVNGALLARLKGRRPRSAVAVKCLVGTNVHGEPVKPKPDPKVAV